MSAFERECAVVIGLGVSGLGAARVLAEEGAAVRVTEERPRSELAGAEELEALGVEILAGGHRPEDLDGATLIVASPGVMEGARVLGWARERGIRIWSELELGAYLCRAPYVAVTGTNGKSTTTELIASMMRAAGLGAIACGNIGHPFSLAAREHLDALAVEASSFQLRLHRSFHPKVSVLLNLAPDHLDWHGSFDAYVAAKARVHELQEADETHVGNADDELAGAVSRTATCRVVWFTLGEPADGGVGYVGGALVARMGEELRLVPPSEWGTALRADLAAATAAALAFGLPAEAIAGGIASMQRLPHRGQEVARAGSVAFVDNSKATNPHAVLAALDDLTDVVLIAGGLSKGIDLSPLSSGASRLAGVVAIGEAAPEIIGVFEGLVPVRKAGSMEEAVRVAFELAPRGGTVLLAPACASYDMFADYGDRGERFTEAALSLAEGLSGHE